MNVNYMKQKWKWQTHNGHGLCDNEESSAKKLTLVDTLGIDRDLIDRQAKLLDTATVASFEFLSRIFLLIEQCSVAEDGF